MATNNANTFFGWAAVAAAAVSLFTLITFMVGMAIGWDVVGLPNDIGSIVLALLNIVVALALVRVVGTQILTNLLLLCAVVAGVVIAVVQLLFVSGVIDFAATASAGFSYGVMALVFVVLNLLAWRTGALPTALAVLGVLANAGGAVASFGTYFLGVNHPLVWLGGAIFTLNCVWLGWFGYLLLSEKLMRLAV